MHSSLSSSSSSLASFLFPFLPSSFGFLPTQAGTQVGRKARPEHVVEGAPAQQAAEREGQQPGQRALPGHTLPPTGQRKGTAGSQITQLPVFLFHWMEKIQLGFTAPCTPNRNAFFFSHRPRSQERRCTTNSTTSWCLITSCLTASSSSTRQTGRAR